MVFFGIAFFGAISGHYHVIPLEFHCKINWRGELLKKKSAPLTTSQSPPRRNGFAGCIRIGTIGIIGTIGGWVEAER